MKKSRICLILGILLVSSLSIAIAKVDKVDGIAFATANISDNSTESNNTQNNTTGNNETGNNQTGNQNNETGNQTQKQVTIKNMTKTRIQDRTNLTFVPWQKRNESECMQGCNCRGAVVTCETENGRTMTIQAGRSGNVIVITTQRVNASTELELEQELTEGNKTKLKAKLSNGEKRELKVLPDQAAEKAKERLRIRECSSENNCTIELSEKDQQLMYEIQLERHSRILGIFEKKMQVRAEVDAENGEIRVKKPWWAFLAIEPEE